MSKVGKCNTINLKWQWASFSPVGRETREAGDTLTTSPSNAFLADVPAKHRSLAMPCKVLDTAHLEPTVSVVPRQQSLLSRNAAARCAPSPKGFNSLISASRILRKDICASAYTPCNSWLHWLSWKLWPCHLYKLLLPDSMNWSQMTCC